MSRDMNLTGRWVGEYLQHDRPHPIAAELVQAGEHLTGSMWDGITDGAYSIFEVASQAGLPPGADEQIVARLRTMFPDAPAAPIRYVTHLPPESALEGRVEGSTVYFLKTYQGIHFGGYKIGDVLVGFQSAVHAVSYRGQLSPDGGEIEGRWWIDPAPGPSHRTEGHFTLRRQEGTGPPPAGNAPPPV
jgi:hypothetical protein